ncbi:hypothetical protein M0811_10265 [Anaeramoeba ignava]|uniref:Uncharacterized protein n=1 Tax=Anaeramoeba ignava TaxID=1746090 RepID=A0A9Q0LEL5_ANAIG|nr:hypothetical protein M0811_10265 [Anaeramoeba ignava]
MEKEYEKMINENRKQPNQETIEKINKSEITTEEDNEEYINRENLYTIIQNTKGKSTGGIDKITTYKSTEKNKLSSKLKFSLSLNLKRSKERLKN